MSPRTAKSPFGQNQHTPPATPSTYLRERDWSLTSTPIDFDGEVWPRVIADAMSEYAYRLLETKPRAFHAYARAARTIDAMVSTTLTHVLTGPRLSLTEVVLAFEEALSPILPDPADHFSLSNEIQPAQHHLASPAAYDTWVSARVHDDLQEALRGSSSPLKAGLWSLSVARSIVSEIGSCGGFTAESHQSGFALLMAIGGAAGSGPPAFRAQQLLALHDAGFVKFIGPRGNIRFESQGFVCESPNVSDSRIAADTVVDAFMCHHSFEHSADPLVHDLSNEQRLRPFTRNTQNGTATTTNSGETDPVTGRIIRTTTPQIPECTSVASQLKINTMAPSSALCPALTRSCYAKPIELQPVRSASHSPQYTSGTHHAHR